MPTENTAVESYNEALLKMKKNRKKFFETAEDLIRDLVLKKGKPEEEDNPDDDVLLVDLSVEDAPNLYDKDVDFDGYEEPIPELMNVSVDKSDGSVNIGSGYGDYSVEDLYTDSIGDLIEYLESL